MKTDKPGREPVKPGDRWKLTPSQRKNLASWIGEGCTPREINKRAAALRSPFMISRQGVDYWRQKLQVRVRELRSEEAAEAALEGFAIKAERIRVLDHLAKRLLADLDEKGFWLPDFKMAGDNVREMERFNSSEIDAIRSTLADIASEMGDRRSTKAIGLEVPAEAGGVKIYVGIDPEKV